MDYNKVILIGRLARDPEVKMSASGKKMVGLTLAVNRRIKKDTDKTNIQTADFIPVTCFGKTAEFVEQNLHTGSAVHVDGRISVRKYDDQNGSAKFWTEVVVSELISLDKKPQNNGFGTPAAEADIPY